MLEPTIKRVGNLIKYTMIKPPDMEIDGFFREAVKGEWIIEDILDAWHELHEFKNILLLNIGPYRTQFATMKNDIPYIYHLSVGDTNYELVFLMEDSKLETNKLKNMEELSGSGKLLVPFNLEFENFPKKYTIDNDADFFKLNSDQILLNSVRLVLDDEHSKLGERETGIKLTGKAAEIAARRAHET